jgi:acetyltransferase
VVKILSDDISHKSDVGGVRLAIKTAEEAREAAGAMLAKVHDLKPQARIRGFTVQPMIERARLQAHHRRSEDATVRPLMMLSRRASVEVVRHRSRAAHRFELARLIAETRPAPLGGLLHCRLSISAPSRCLVRAAISSRARRSASSTSIRSCGRARAWCSTPVCASS